LAVAVTSLWTSSQAPKGENHFESLGIFELDSSKNFSVLFSTEGAKGIVHIDAIQVVPVDGKKCRHLPKLEEVSSDTQWMVPLHHKSVRWFSKNE
jgi:hypothetical protein